MKWSVAIISCATITIPLSSMHNEMQFYCSLKEGIPRKWSFFRSGVPFLDCGWHCTAELHYDSVLIIGILLRVSSLITYQYTLPHSCIVIVTAHFYLYDVGGQNHFLNLLSLMHHYQLSYITNCEFSLFFIGTSLYQVILKILQYRSVCHRDELFCFILTRPILCQHIDHHSYGLHA